MADTPVVSVTAAAREVVLEARSEEIDATALALWLEVRSGPGKFEYDMYFQAGADARPNDVVLRHDDFDVVVPSSSVEKLRGSTLDVDASGGMVIINPNEPKTPDITAVPEGDLSGPVAQRVMAVLEQQINPSIASHGGWAQLVAVEEDTVYLRMGGGCQGCGMAKVTLSQGIEVAIRESVPEIARVVDVTDHRSGANPYYEAAKK